MAEGRSGECEASSEYTSGRQRTGKDERGLGTGRHGVHTRLVRTHEVRGKKGGSPSGALGPTHLRIAGRRQYLKILARVALAGAQKQKTHLEACADVEARGGRPRLQRHLPVRRNWAHWEPRWPPVWAGVGHHLRGSPLLACAMAEESCLSPACFHRPQRFLSDWMLHLAESLWEIKSFHVVSELKRARGLGGLAGLLGQGRS